MVTDGADWALAVSGVSTTATTANVSRSSERLTRRCTIHLLSLRGQRSTSGSGEPRSRASSGEPNSRRDRLLDRDAWPTFGTMIIRGADPEVKDVLAASASKSELRPI